MKKVSSEQITYHQFMYTLIGTMIGTGILSLPNSMAKSAKQDGWISAIAAAWYPLFIVLIGIYFAKKYPNDDILSVSKKCFGRLLGSLLCLIFVFQFLVDLVSVTVGYSDIARVYIVDFLMPVKITSILLLLGAYCTYKGLKLIGRLNEVTYYFLVLLLFIPLMALRDGSLLNVSPILGSGIKSIIDGTKDAIFAYAGIEIIFFIYPYMNDKKNIKSSALKSVLITAFVYGWITFMTIFFAGPDVILNSHWSVMLINETINLPFINSFTFIFMYFWSLIIFKTIVNLYFCLSYGLSNAVAKFNIQKLCFFIFPIVLYAVFNFRNETFRRSFIEKVSPLITYYNLGYLLLLTIIIHFKKGNKNESA